MRFDDNTAIVTGASGAAIGKRLSSEDAGIVVTPLVRA